MSLPGKGSNSQVGTVPCEEECQKAVVGSPPQHFWVIFWAFFLTID